MDTINQGLADLLENSSPADKNARTGQRIRDLEIAMNAAQPFHRTATITSAAAATPVILVPDADIPPGKICYVSGFIARVNGATAWATTTNVKIQDTAGTPVDFVTIAVAALTANTTIHPTTSNVTLESAMILGTGGTVNRGIRLVGNANGTGSNLVVTVFGFFK